MNTTSSRLLANNNTPGKWRTPFSLSLPQAWLASTPRYEALDVYQSLTVLHNSEPHLLLSHLHWLLFESALKHNYNEKNCQDLCYSIFHNILHIYFQMKVHYFSNWNMVAIYLKIISQIFMYSNSLHFFNDHLFNNKFQTLACRDLCSQPEIRVYFH